MKPAQTLFYAIGEFVYAIAGADNYPKQNGKDQLRKILISGFKKCEQDFDAVKVVTHILQKSPMDSKTAYLWAIREMKMNSKLVDDELEEKFVHLIQEVNEAYPLKKSEEQNLVNSFVQDLKAAHT